MVLLSATIPVDVLEVTKKFMRDPIRILVKKEELSLEGIRQFYINVQKEVQGPKLKIRHVYALFPLNALAIYFEFHSEYFL